jgi:flavorubredoxin
MVRDITPQIKYIGVDDDNLDLFESQYPVPHGMTYNSYVIMDEKVAVVDTTDGRTAEEWKSNLCEALCGRKPDYLIVHHMEPDHAALAADVLKQYPDLKIVCSDKALKMLYNFFEGVDFDSRVITVKEGDELSLGKHQLVFHNAMMVHWPEVIVTYDATDKVLFSADAFGKFGVYDAAGGWTDEARRYYFNICGKYGPQVRRLLTAVSDHEINYICSAHGPVLKGDIEKYVSLYDTWSSYEPEADGVLVAYASIHGGTRKVAETLADMLKAKGAREVVVADLSRCDQSWALTEAFRLSRCVLAAASYDASVFPPMYDFLHHLRLKAWQNRRVGIIENGSWAPSAAKVMRMMLDDMKEIEIVDPQVTIWSRMKKHDIDALEELADAVLGE